MSTPNPMDRLITLMSGAVSAGAEDALRLATALRQGRIDVDEVQRWYDQRRDQSMELMRQIGDELSLIRKQGAGRFVTSSRLAVSKRADGLRRAASRSRRRALRRRSLSSRARRSGTSMRRRASTRARARRAHAAAGSRR